MKQTTQLIVAVGLAIIGLLVVLTSPTGLAIAADQCAAPGGAGGCHPTIQAAINAAGSGDTVRVVAGTYNENLVINKNLTLLGGFDDTTLTSRTPRSSIIDGGGNDSVIKITNGAAVTIDGFTITGGDATANNGAGGGIDIRQATAVIRDNLIKGNVASSDPAVRGRGGGIDVISSTSPVLISDNMIQANLAYSVALTSPTAALFGIGGGIWIDAASSVNITDNQILSNTAARTDIPGPAFGGGGGIGGFSDDTTITIDGNTIQGNIGNEVSGDGNGGGIALFGIAVATMTNNSIMQNTAAVSATFAQGGGIRASTVQALTLTDNQVVQNIAAISGPDSQGGGMYLSSSSSGSGQSLTLTGNWVMSNTAGVTVTGSTSFGGPFASGGGVRIWGGDAGNDTLTMQDNHLIGNVTARSMTTSASTGMGHAEGGGLTVERISTTHIISNEVRANFAVQDLSLSGSGGWGGRPSGGGLHLRENDTVTVSDNEVRDNVTAEQQIVNEVSSGSDGGGIALENVETVTVSNNIVAGNTAVVNGSITSNTGENYFPNGGGIMVNCFGKPNCNVSVIGNDILNNVVADAVTVSGTDADGRTFGGGIRALRVQTLTLTDNTVAQNTAATSAPSAQGGGINLAEISIALLQGNVISGNTGNLVGSNGVGGGMEVAESTVEMNHNRILGNQTTQSGFGSPAVWAWKSTLTSTNDVFARNTGGIGSGTDGSPARMTIINDTFYDNGDRGIEANDLASTVYVTNTIVYSHEDGLRLNNPASTLSGDYNLLSNNTNYSGGATGGPNDILNQGPLFVNAAADDFHLSSGSPAIDKGNDAVAPAVDFEEDSRPIDGDLDGTARVDIGADEFVGKVLYFPILFKNS